jgi:class 3 adenylate cyclase
MPAKDVKATSSATRTMPPTPRRSKECPVWEERLQRRLAAILSADVVGYSRLMGLDEAGTLSRLNGLQRELIDPTIAAHAGRILKLLGDGALDRSGGA